MSTFLAPVLEKICPRGGQSNSAHDIKRPWQWKAPERFYPFAPAKGILNIRGQTECWLDVDREYCRTVEMKKLIFLRSGNSEKERTRDDLRRVTDASGCSSDMLQEACIEAFMCILETAAAQFPDLLEVTWNKDKHTYQGDTRPSCSHCLPTIVRNLATGDVHVVPECFGHGHCRPEEFLHLAAMLVQEDFVLLLPDDIGAPSSHSDDGAKRVGSTQTRGEDHTGCGQGKYVMAAHAVCFPDRWSPEEKMGKTVDEIHTSVPHYSSTIATAVNGFLRNRLKAGDSAYIRFNYTVQEGGNLVIDEDADELAATKDRHGGQAGEPSRCPPRDDKDSLDGQRQPAAVEEDEADLHLRVERQGFKKLACGAIVFSIRTYITPVADIPKEIVEPHLREALTGKANTSLSREQQGIYGQRVLAQIASRRVKRRSAHRFDKLAIAAGIAIVIACWHRLRGAGRAKG